MTVRQVRDLLSIYCDNNIACGDLELVVSDHPTNTKYSYLNIKLHIVDTEKGEPEYQVFRFPLHKDNRVAINACINTVAPAIPDDLYWAKPKEEQKEEKATKSNQDLNDIIKDIFKDGKSGFGK